MGLYPGRSGEVRHELEGTRDEGQQGGVQDIGEASEGGLGAAG